MRDLTTGPISNHLIAMSIPMIIGTVVQTLYFMVDLYFVGNMGDAILAGVSSAGILHFNVMALTQVLNVGAISLIARAVGRKDKVEVNDVFQQTMILSFACAVFVLVIGYSIADWYMQNMSADQATRVAGVQFIHYLLPGLALQFPLTASGAILRGMGIVKPAMFGQMLTVFVNIVLAPVLIAGWGTDAPMGAAGAGLATSLGAAAGTLVLFYYIVAKETNLQFSIDQVKIKFETWKKIFAVGLPAGAEFFFMFVYMAVIHSVVSKFGPAAQAGFGLGGRLMQSIFLPVMAISFAIAPIAGQNFGAKLYPRVRETLYRAMTIESILMFGLTLLCQIQPRWLVQFFSKDEAVIQIASEFLQIISWNFVASGIIFACSGMFQALGNTIPALISTATRIFSFAVPVLIWSRLPNFHIVYIWYISVATVLVQMLLSLWFLRREMNKHLPRHTVT